MNHSIDEVLDRYYQTVKHCNLRGQDHLLSELATSSVEELRSGREDERHQMQTAVSSGNNRGNVSVNSFKTFALAQWSAIMQQPLYRVTFVALMVGSIALCITGTSGVSSRAAWAAVVDSLNAVSSAKYEFSVELPDSKPSVGVYWVHSPGRYREESSNGTIRVVDSGVGKILHLQTNQKEALVVELTDLKTAGTQMDYFLEIRQALLSEKTDVNTTREALGNKHIEGQEVVGFRIVGPERTTVVWGDPVTGLPFRIEITKARNLLPGAKVTLSGFEFNPELDDSLFSVTPPAGYLVHSQKMSVAQPSEKDFVDALDSYSRLSKGSFPKTLDTKSFQDLAKALGLDKKLPQGEAMEEWMERCTMLGRGYAFALGLPPEAKASYAGSNAKRSEVDKVIFWYKPVGSKKYRVLYADIDIRETDAEPVAKNAERLNSMVGNEKSD